MHKDFAEWYRSAGIQPPSGDDLLKRWTGIEAYQVERAEVITLAAMFYELAAPTEDFLGNFRSVFQQADPLFRMRDNDRELLVLAGAELIDVVERGNREIADFAALCLVCPAAQNLRPSPAVPDLPEIAARYLSKRSVTRTKSTVETDSDELSTALVGAGAPFDKLGPAFRKVQLAVPKLQVEVSVIAEESNMLWWLFSEFSRDLNQPWKKIEAPVAAIVSGKELADLTRILPGPIAASAFLDKVIRSSKSEVPESVVVTEAVIETPLEWRQGLVKKGFAQELETIAPVRRAIKLSINGPENDAWQQMFADATKIPANAKVAPHILAYQMFLETLLNRSFDLAE